MAAVYEIERLEFIKIPYGNYMKLAGIKNDMALSDYCSAWSNFSEKYGGLKQLQLGIREDCIFVTGPRSCLIELKYDLEKKSYE